MAIIKIYPLTESGVIVVRFDENLFAYVSGSNLAVFKNRYLSKLESVEVLPDIVDAKYPGFNREEHEKDTYRVMPQITDVGERDDGYALVLTTGDIPVTPSELKTLLLCKQGSN